MNAPSDIRHAGQDYAEWIEQVRRRADDLLLTINLLQYGDAQLRGSATKVIEFAVQSLDQRKK